MAQPPSMHGTGANSSHYRNQRDNLHDAAHGGASADIVAPANPTPVATVPFIWQHDRQLLLLDMTKEGWITAEFRFDPTLCGYVEVRRATYEWSREASGALLARGSDLDGSARERLATSMSIWMVWRRQVSGPDDPFANH